MVNPRRAKRLILAWIAMQDYSLVVTSAPSTDVGRTFTNSHSTHSYEVYMCRPAHVDVWGALPK